MGQREQVLLTHWQLIACHYWPRSPGPGPVSGHMIDKRLADKFRKPRKKATTNNVESQPWMKTQRAAAMTTAWYAKMPVRGGKGKNACGRQPRNVILFTRLKGAEMKGGLPADSEFAPTVCQIATDDTNNQQHPDSNATQRCCVDFDGCRWH